MEGRALSFSVDLCPESFAAGVAAALSRTVGVPENDQCYETCARLFSAIENADYMDAEMVGEAIYAVHGAYLTGAVGAFAMAKQLERYIEENRTGSWSGECRDALAALILEETGDREVLEDRKGEFIASAVWMAEEMEHGKMFLQACGGRLSGPYVDQALLDLAMESSDLALALTKGIEAREATVERLKARFLQEGRRGVPPKQPEKPEATAEAPATPADPSSE